MGVFRYRDLGEKYEYLFELEVEIFDILVEFATSIGLADAPPQAIGVKTGRGDEFLHEIGSYSPILDGMAMTTPDERGIAVLALVEPVIAQVCMVELIEAREDESTDTTLFALNQAHFVVDTETVAEIAASRGQEVAIRGSESQFRFAKIPLNEDVHIKVRDHTALDLALDQLQEMGRAGERG